jgi:hypothetical protein
MCIRMRKPFIFAVFDPSAHESARWAREGCGSGWRRVARSQHGCRKALCSTGPRTSIDCQVRMSDRTAARWLQSPGGQGYQWLSALLRLHLDDLDGGGDDNGTSSGVKERVKLVKQWPLVKAFAHLKVEQFKDEVTCASGSRQRRSTVARFPGVGAARAPVTCTTPNAGGSRGCSSGRCVAPNRSVRAPRTGSRHQRSSGQAGRKQCRWTWPCSHRI